MMAQELEAIACWAAPAGRAARDLPVPERLSAP